MNADGSVEDDFVITGQDASFTCATPRHPAPRRPSPLPNTSSRRPSNACAEDAHA